MTIDTPTPPSAEHAQGNNAGGPDPALAPLSRRQAERLARLALTTATNLGLRVRYDGRAALVPTVASAETPVLGLSNLARILSQYDEARWPALIDEHFAQLLHQLGQGPPAPPVHPERELIQRLVPRDALPTDWTADQVDFLPGLVSVAATAQDGIVTMFLDPSDLGLTWSEAEAFGLANLRSLLDDVDHIEHDDVQVAVLTGSSFTASRALVLDTVLHETLHLDRPPPHGVLAALPTRDTLVLHVIEDLRVIPALGLLLNVAARCYSRDPGPLTPDVFLVTPDLTWSPATTATTDYAALRLSPELESLTRLLATREPPGGRR